MQKIGVLTGGGDCPGINPVLRALAMSAFNKKYRVIGIRDGWSGLIDKDLMELKEEDVSAIISRGGTILGTSRTNPYKQEGAVDKCKKNFKSLGIECLVAIGGEDTLGVATKLYKEGLNIVGVPKTIDNDLSATDYTFGFDTSINIVTEAIDRLHTTSESHHRIMIVEIMGRHAGWIALYAGIAGGADVILIPEIPIDLKEVVNTLKAKRKKGKKYGIVAVAEGAMLKDKSAVIQEENLDSFGHVRLGGIGSILGKKIEEMTGYETRVTVLGHLQRGGAPSASDRVLGTRFGVAAFKLVEKNRYGRMVSLSGNEVIDVPLEKAVGKLKTVDPKLYAIQKTFEL